MERLEDGEDEGQNFYNPLPIVYETPSVLPSEVEVSRGVAYCLLPIAYCLLPIAHYPIAHYPLPIAHCPLPIAYCPLPIAYCLFPDPRLSC